MNFLYFTGKRARTKSTKKMKNVKYIAKNVRKRGIQN